MKKTMAWIAILGLAGACGSCSAPASKAAAAPTPEVATTSPDAENVEPDILWADKTMEQKKTFMKAEVVPAMALIWKDSPDPKEEVTCVTCHGPGAIKGEFSMPSTGIPALNPADQFSAHKDEAEWLKFMATKVAPTMVQTLGVEPYNMETQKGFGCFGCHTMIHE